MDKDKYINAGQMLKMARTSGRRKREISTISRLLCISEEYLDALERADYKSIPELVYVLGFARNYAMELGLDPDEIVEKIKGEMGLIKKDESPEDADDIDNNSDKDALSEINSPKNVSKFVKRIKNNWKWLFISILLLGVVIFSISFVLNITDDKPSEQISATYTIEPTEEDNINSQELPYQQAVRERFGNKNKVGAKVIIQANAESWVKIEDKAGNTIFSRVLVAGDVYYVPSTDKFKATFGNAGGLDIWVNGAMIPAIGKDRQRKSGIILTPENLIPNKIDVQ